MVGLVMKGTQRASVRDRPVRKVRAGPSGWLAQVLGGFQHFGACLVTHADPADKDVGNGALGDAGCRGDIMYRRQVASLVTSHCNVTILSHGIEKHKQENSNRQGASCCSPSDKNWIGMGKGCTPPVLRAGCLLRPLRPSVAPSLGVSLVRCASVKAPGSPVVAHRRKESEPAL